MSEENDPLLAALNADPSASSSNNNQQEASPEDQAREKALTKFKNKLLEHRQWDARLKELRLSIRGSGEGL